MACGALAQLTKHLKDLKQGFPLNSYFGKQRRHPGSGNRPGFRGKKNNFLWDFT